jgi:hypothetical protein
VVINGEEVLPPRHEDEKSLLSKEKALLGVLVVR